MADSGDELSKKEYQEHLEAQIEGALVNLEYDLTKALGEIAELRFFVDKLIH